MINDNYVKKINDLSQEKQLLLGLCYVERHQQVVREFDKYYKEELFKLFKKKSENAIDLILNESFDFKDMQESFKEIEEMTPDTDDYPDTQGSLAQNAFVMMLHCYQFILTSNTEDIIAALNILEYTIDVINYVVDENYDYEMECRKEFILLDKYLEILNEHQVVDEKVVAILREISSKNMFANPIM